MDTNADKLLGTHPDLGILAHLSPPPEGTRAALDLCNDTLRIKTGEDITAVMQNNAKLK